jgi:serine/threonine protein phosphatase PrpC
MTAAVRDAVEGAALRPPGLHRPLRACGVTDPGRRAHNEDCFACDPEQGIFVVADGVGGAAAGEVAAGIACDLIPRRLALRTGTPAERMREAIAAANNEIYRQSLETAGCFGMGCVLTAAVVAYGRVTVGHVGDTRLYMIDGAGLHKVTRDHSVVGVQEDAGVLTEEEAMRHPRRNEILRDVGSAPHQPEDAGFVDLYEFPLRSGSTLLLCSDGLTDLVPAAAIRAAVAAHPGHPDDMARCLLDLALDAGGTDNITVLVVEPPPPAWRRIDVFTPRP